MMKPRHTIKVKGEVTRRRLEGVSLNQLASEFRLPKSTIQGWVKKLELIEESKNKILTRARLARIESLKNRRIMLPRAIYSDHFSPELVRFFAHSLFDGSIFHDQVVYYSSHLSLAKQFAADGERLFNLRPRWYQTKEKVYRVHFFSKNLIDFLVSRRTSFLENSTKMGKIERLEFLKAFFDDEGSITFRPETGKKAIRGYQKDINLLKLITKLLKKLGIASGLENINHSPEVVIRGRKNIERYGQLISFSAGVSFLATRRNSYYNQPIEKKLVLKQLLMSYCY